MNKEINRNDYIIHDSNININKNKSKKIKNEKNKNISTKFRSFLIGYKKDYGYLLLQANKNKKGIHFQLPGGRIDKNELQQNGLNEASKIAMIRELFEETGIKINENRLHRVDLGRYTHYLYIYAQMCHI